MKIILTVTDGPHAGLEYDFEEHDTFIVGRASYAHFRLPRKDQHFSRTHFMVEVSPPLCRLMDMASTNGTFVNRRRVSEIDLKHGDLIAGGDTVIQVRIEGDGSTDETRQPGKDHPGNAPRRTLAEPPSTTPRQTLDETSQQPPARRTLAEPSHPIDGEDAQRQTHVEPSPAKQRPVSADDASPTQIADFRVVEEIGRGGMGVVYKAEDTRSGETVALKCIRPLGQVSRRDFDRFFREASILKDLRHANIVRFLEQGSVDGQLYFAMEFVDGQNASQLLERQGRLPTHRVADIVCQLLSALEFAHSNQFVHRDVKPENILVDSSAGKDVVKLADFGLARVYQESKLSGLTMHGEMGGSLAYIAPEQITSFRDARPAGDIYSVGATLYRLLTGAYTYDFPKAFNKRVLKILQDDPVPILERKADLRPDLANVVHRALARDPAKRFQSAEVMRQALLPFAQMGPT